MKKLLLSSVAVSALMMSASGNAADMPAPVKAAPPVPVYSWTGCAIGVQGGWGLQRNKIKQTQFNTFASGGTLVVLSSASSGNVDTSGGVFGAQVGCDYQFAGTPWVIGVQGMFLGSDINGFRQDPHNGAVQTVTPAAFGPGSTFGGGVIGVRTGDIASVTARLGWSGWNRQTLLYVKGGGAWVDTQLDMRNSAIGGFANLNNRAALFDSTNAGWTIGGGVEWKFATNWSAFAEYNFYDFNNSRLFSLVGTPHVGPGVNVQGRTLDSEVILSTFTVGVNYRFNWGY